MNQLLSLLFLPKERPISFWQIMDSYKPDQTDIKILNLLQTDGLMTYRQLAKETHRSQNPIVERVNRLKKLGYITGTVALINVKKIKSVFTAFPMIQLKNHSEDTFVSFQELMKQHSEIMECHHVMGQFDFILKIVVADANSYNEFLRKNISTLEYVLRIESFPMLAEIKRDTAFKL
ncbi:Lrp/AsnC family transcriptional regulator [Pedobacter polaris]|uniref:Lrp/AsnC family transcriptional regulator n=1 Tax=Pedobacter polaris TaxID=2571273 RepID=A0A4U1CWR2_9SPHI|nr:Lrp/AsnC family transcriptional regulator [Pedobacter polaris]TKC10428.1 Lrp/AsnC family transcriptional regulator [Pedobacter polaris]